LKIALLTDGIYPYKIGGIQKHSYYLAKYFAKEKVTVDIYHPGINNNEQDIKFKDYFEVEELDFLNFITVPFPASIKFPGHYVYASYLYTKKLFKILEHEEEYNCIYGQGFTSWYFVRKKNFAENIISNLHGLEMFQNTINIKNRLEQLLLSIPANEIIRKSNRQISLGGKLTEILYNTGAKENSVIEIPNGIDQSWIIDNEDYKKPLSKKRLRFVFIGRYERRKGIEELHEVVRKTIDQFNYEVQFIGPIPVEKQISHSNIHYMGLIQDSEVIKTGLLQADILVCPSYSEGMPTVILEAMACGCAIIATDVGAVNTMVDKHNGWLIEGDIEQGLEIAIKDALSIGFSELHEKKIASINRVKANFTWEHVITQTIAEIAKRF
jgi:glycosyltransferase involved in cell wall biosynthesis